jgi:drug/metabolite transporter (DMT)-like permease
MDDPLSIPYSGIVFCVGLAVVCTIIPIILFIEATYIIGNVKASLMSIVEPATTVFIGITFFAETFTWTQVTGLFIMLVAIVVIEIKSIIKPKLNNRFSTFLYASSF